ncbi:MAG: P-loop NTPase [Candidatus Rehaiarchaeum fermentans]|nr:Mrp/NBP35 family ATP-binding protein [Candidatus Rehaiarchaeum fermentans]
MNEIEKQIYNILDPEIQIPIGKLGMIKKVEKTENELYVEIKLTVPNCPLQEEIKKEIEKIGALNNLQTKINFDVMTREELEYAKQIAYSEKRGLPESIKRYEKKDIKKIIGIFSSKGGVGKSTVSALFSIFLQRKGYKVGILDGDISGPSIATLFGIEEMCKIENRKIIPQEKNGIKIVGRDIVIGKGVGIWRGPIVSNLIKQLYSETDWSTLDFLIVDFPPGTSDIPITAMQSIPLDGIILVTTPSKLALDQLRASFSMAQSFNIPILGIISNMGSLNGAEVNIPFLENVEEKIENHTCEIDFSPILSKLVK